MTEVREREAGGCEDKRVGNPRWNSGVPSFSETLVACTCVSGEGSRKAVWGGKRGCICATAAEHRRGEEMECEESAVEEREDIAGTHSRPDVP